MKEKKNSSQGSHIFITMWGLLMHIILLWGVLDANFHSPIVPGLSAIPMPKGSPAKRVFIFVADGLRFRTFNDHMPEYLKSVIGKNGIWGISHTRMPTESRPGNIAIVAGLYEDPSALFKGWKENPVDFDNIFNHSRRSWLWGSPDIIPLFTKNGKSNIHGKSYPATWQDFGDKSNVTKRLDEWVFNQYWNWLENDAPNYKTDDRIVIYFHLLGCDTIGHAVKPQSKEYVDTMTNVDHNIKKVVELTENYFEKDTTAYIFTADHGMTDWGSHGSGSTDETETPFVAWGAGVNSKVQFINIEQADITPIVSTLLGIPVPINNEGILPYNILDPKFEKFTAKAFLTNAEQLAEQVKANRHLATGKITGTYWKDEEFNKKLEKIKKKINEMDTDDAFLEIKDITTLAKQTLMYYRRYKTNRLLFCLLIIWINWIALLFVDLSNCFSWMVKENIALIILNFALMIEYMVAGCNGWRLTGYGSISIVSIWFSFKKIISKNHILKIYSGKNFIEFFGVLLLIFMMSISLINRSMLSISMVLTVSLQKLIFDKNASFDLLISGALLAIFPLLPVVGSQPNIYLVLFALIISTIPIIMKKHLNKYNKEFEIIRIILTFLLCTNFIDGRSWLSWFLLVSTPIAIWLYPKDIKFRFFGITVALLSPLTLLSASYEPLFFLTFAYHLLHWPIYEYSQKIITSNEVLSLRNFSVAAILMLYTLLCFFGTGNMASISSFDPSWTRHFLTIFSPFTMMSLILLKIIIPLILVGCLIHALDVNSNIFSAVLLLGDCLAMPQMYKVTNQGSWLDIGSGISRFVIVIMLPCLLLVVNYLTKFFTTISLQSIMKPKVSKSQKLRI